MIYTLLTLLIYNLFAHSVLASKSIERISSSMFKKTLDSTLVRLKFFYSLVVNYSVYINFSIFFVILLI